MKHFNVYVMTAALLLSLPCIAQKSNTTPDQQNFKRLRIGDTVPMESIVFKNVRNYPGGKAKLSDFKGKYIILDFWTKGCTSCIAAFPHMEELQNQFKDDIQVLLVTKNTEEELMLLSKNSPNVKNTKLPMIIGDQILATQLFPHGTVPYHVWLDKTGKVVATTYSQETNATNLKDLIAGKKLNLLVKNEAFDEELFKSVNDEKTSLLKAGNSSFQDCLKYYAQIPLPRNGNMMPATPSSIPNLSYYSMFMSFLPGDLGWGQGFLRDSVGKEKGFRYYNTPLTWLYEYAYDIQSDIKIIPEGSSKLLFEEITDTTNMARHLINNSYCYESSLPNYTVENAKFLLQEDLTRFFGMRAIIEERPIKHLTLTRLGISAEKRLWAKNQAITPGNEVVKESEEGWIFKGSGSLGFIFNYLVNANRRSEDPVIVDATNFSKVEMKKNIDVYLKLEGFIATPENILLMRKELAKYGLGLKEEVRKIKVLVLKAVL